MEPGLRGKGSRHPNKGDSWEPCLPSALWDNCWSHCMLSLRQTGTEKQSIKMKAYCYDVYLCLLRLNKKKKKKKKKRLQVSPIAVVSVAIGDGVRVGTSQ